MPLSINKAKLDKLCLIHSRDQDMAVTKAEIDFSTMT